MHVNRGSCPVRPLLSHGAGYGVKFITNTIVELDKKFKAYVAELHTKSLYDVLYWAIDLWSI